MTLLFEPQKIDAQEVVSKLAQRMLQRCFMDSNYMPVSRGTVERKAYKNVGQNFYLSSEVSQTLQPNKE